MKTKSLILETALRLFNSHGFEHVSTYDIAKELNISQGNLTYHFPTKKDMINSLAKRMISEIDSFILRVDSSFSFIDFHTSFHHTYTINLKYKFLYMNYSRIVLNDEDLNEYFLENSAGRKKLLRKMLLMLSDNGYITENTIINVNDHMADTINLLAIYWVPESEIYHKGKSEEEKIEHFVGLVFLLFQPYLTEKGKENFDGLVDYTS